MGGGADLGTFEGWAGCWDLLTNPPLSQAEGLYVEPGADPPESVKGQGSSF